MLVEITYCFLEGLKMAKLIFFGLAALILIENSHAALVVTAQQEPELHSIHKFWYLGKTPEDAIAQARADVAPCQFTVFGMSCEKPYQILGGCANAGWFGYVRLDRKDALFPQTYFIACGFSTREGALSALYKQAASSAPSYELHRVLTAYDDGKGHSDQESAGESRKRKKPFGCFTSDYFNGEKMGQAYLFGAPFLYPDYYRDGDYYVMTRSSDVSAIERCNDKYLDKK